MSGFIDLTGQKFDRLTVIKRMKNTKHNHAQWLCECICGKSSIVCSNSLRNGTTRSCGCLQQEARIKNNTKHGYVYHKLYAIWNSMIQRCNNPKNKGYHNYGGRGIAVCDRWLEFKSFLEDMGNRPEGLTLDRIDNDRDYCKENCRWATYAQQNRNYRRNVFITINNETKCLKDWCQELNLNYSMVCSRIYRRK